MRRLLLQELEGGKELDLFQAAARLLADRRPPGAAEVVLRFLPAAGDELLEDELFAALAVVATAGGKTDPAVVTAAKDASPLRRGAAAWVLGRSSRAEERALVLPLLADADPRVRLRAAQALLVGKEKEAVAVLIALLDEATPGISWRAHEVLLSLAGEHAPAVSLGTGSNAERRKCRDAWTSWWRDHDRKLDLSRVELPDHFRGRVVVACLEGYQNGKGRVWEFGANWKVIWQLDNIRGAADVQVLPGNRVLVAEYDGEGAVSERDLTGKVLWKHKPRRAWLSAPAQRQHLHRTASTNCSSFRLTASRYSRTPARAATASTADHAQTAKRSLRLCRSRSEPGGSGRKWPDSSHLPGGSGVVLHLRRFAQWKLPGAAAQSQQSGRVRPNRQGSLAVSRARRQHGCPTAQRSHARRHRRPKWSPHHCRSRSFGQGAFRTTSAGKGISNCRAVMS